MKLPSARFHLQQFVVSKQYRCVSDLRASQKIREILQKAQSFVFIVQPLDYYPSVVELSLNLNIVISTRRAPPPLDSDIFEVAWNFWKATSFGPLRQADIEGARYECVDLPFRISSFRLPCLALGHLICLSVHARTISG